MIKIFWQSQKQEVRAVVLFSEDNSIDGVVLNVLIRNARQIYQDLGISVPVPAESESVVKAVVKAVFEGWRGEDAQQLRLDLLEMNTVQAFHENWKRLLGVKLTLKDCTRAEARSVHWNPG